MVIVRCWKYNHYELSIECKKSCILEEDHANIMTIGYIPYKFSNSNNNVNVFFSVAHLQKF